MSRGRDDIAADIRLQRARSGETGPSLLDTSLDMLAPAAIPTGEFSAIEICSNSSHSFDSAVRSIARA